MKTEGGMAHLYKQSDPLQLADEEMTLVENLQAMGLGLMTFIRFTTRHVEQMKSDYDIGAGMKFVPEFEARSFNHACDVMGHANVKTLIREGALLVGNHHMTSLMEVARGAQIWECHELITAGRSTYPYWDHVSNLYLRIRDAPLSVDGIGLRVIIDHKGNLRKRPKRFISRYHSYRKERTVYQAIPWDSNQRVTDHHFKFTGLPNRTSAIVVKAIYYGKRSNIRKIKDCFSVNFQPRGYKGRDSTKIASSRLLSHYFIAMKTPPEITLTQTECWFLVALQEWRNRWSSTGSLWYGKGGQRLLNLLPETEIDLNRIARYLDWVNSKKLPRLKVKEVVQFYLDNEIDLTRLNPVKKGD